MPPMPRDVDAIHHGGFAIKIVSVTCQGRFDGGNRASKTCHGCLRRRQPHLNCLENACQTEVTSPEPPPLVEVRNGVEVLRPRMTPTRSGMMFSFGKQFNCKSLRQDLSQESWRSSDSVLKSFPTLQISRGDYGIKIIGQGLTAGQHEQAVRST